MDFIDFLWIFINFIDFLLILLILDDIYRPPGGFSLTGANIMIWSGFSRPEQQPFATGASESHRLRRQGMSIETRFASNNTQRCKGTWSKMEEARNVLTLGRTSKWNSPGGDPRRSAAIGGNEIKPPSQTQVNRARFPYYVRWQANSLKLILLIFY